MNKATGGGAGTVLYSLFFFGFLFGPLVIMVVTAFNSSSFPRITPWECFTTEWFSVLVNNARLMGGLGKSVIIGIGVVACAVPIGLAGALALSELPPRLRAALYTVLITPILIPGVVLGISTIVFWGLVGRAFGDDHASTFYNGLFLTLIGQITFISAYAMLVFSARLQRFDPTLTEAALDLGATPGQCFRKILLPFLKPAIGSAAFLTLLASFENYNTTVFTILSQSTFTTALASKVRLGTDPSLSALAVIIIGLTLVGAMVHEAYTRRQALLRSGKPEISPLYANPMTRIMTHPAGIAVMLIALAGLLVYLGSHHDASACKADILEKKRAVQEQLLREQRERIRQQREEAASPTVGAPASSNPSPFGGAFAPGTLAPKEETGPANPSPFGGAFKPNALKPKE